MRSLKLLVFLVLTHISVVSFAQTNFLPGYYVKNSNDTIRGFIEYVSEAKNSLKCVFKPSLDSKKVFLFPDEILAFVIDNKAFYETHSFLNAENQTELGFFKVDVRGKLTLFKYQSRYFVSGSNNDVLAISKKTIKENGKIVDDYSGFSNLKLMVKDCPEVSGAYLDGQYRLTPNYREIIIKYNACVKSESIVSEKLKIKPHVSFGVHAGALMTTVTTAISGKVTGLNLKNGFSYTAGAAAYVFIPRLDERLNLVVEASYARYNQYLYFSQPDILNVVNNDLFVDYTFVRVPLMIRFSPGKFFFDAGVQDQLVVAQSYTWRYEFVFPDNTVQSFQQNPKEMPTSTWGLIVGAGFKSMIANHPIRYYARFSKNDDARTSGNTYQNIEFVVSYQLNK